MAAATILEIEKQPYLNNRLTDRHVIWHDDAFWPIPLYRPWKLQTFENPRWRTAVIVKVEKSQYLGNGLTDRQNLAQWRIFTLHMEEGPIEGYI